MRRSVLTTAALAAATIIMPITLTAAPAAADNDTELTLTIARGLDPLPADRRAHLSCFPPGGDHPRARAACSAIAESNGRLYLQTGSAHCPGLWRPVTVAASGTWRGRSIYYRQTFPNACLLAGLKSPIFAF